MSRKDRKRQRKEAVRAEIARREKDRRDRSSLTRDDMLKLLDFVGEKVMIDGHTNDFTYTCEWLRKNDFEEERAIKFFNDENIQNDWSLCVKGDPFALFGPSTDRLSWMPIDRSHLEALIDWLDKEVPRRGCNHDLALSSKWLKKHNCPVHPTLMALLAHGGGCDCEVVMNVKPETIYP